MTKNFHKTMENIAKKLVEEAEQIKESTLETAVQQSLELLCELNLLVEEEQFAKIGDDMLKMKCLAFMAECEVAVAVGTLEEVVQSIRLDPHFVLTEDELPNMQKNHPESARYEAAIKRHKFVQDLFSSVCDDPQIEQAIEDLKKSFQSTLGNIENLKKHQMTHLNDLKEESELDMMICDLEFQGDVLNKTDAPMDEKIANAQKDLNQAEEELNEIEDSSTDEEDQSLLDFMEPAPLSHSPIDAEVLTSQQVQQMFDNSETQ